MDNSVAAPTSSVLGFMLGNNRHIADLNQNIAEPHAAIIAPASMNGLVLTPYWFGGWVVIILAIMVMFVFEEARPMRQIVFVLLAVVALGGVLAYTAPLSGQSAGEAAPIYGIKIPAGYRDWKLISVAHEEGNFNDLRAQLGNDVAINAYREGRLPFPDGTIIAALHWHYASSEENNKAFGRAQSFIAGSPTNIQFMVKDSKKYAGTGGWGFADFTDGKPADEAMHRTCFPCHEPVKARDFVFTRYAP